MKRIKASRTKGTVRFILKEPNAERETPINLIFSYGRNNRLKKSTGYKIHPRLFDVTKQRVKHNVNASEFRSINNHLNDLESYVYSVVLDFESKGIQLNKEVLKSSIDNYLGKSEVTVFNEKPTEFFNYIESYINHKTKTLSSGPNGRKNATVKSYEQTVNHLKDFEVDTGVKLEFETIDLDFYYEFLNHMNTKTYGENAKFYSLNTIGKHIGNLKAFMNSAIADGITSNMKFTQRAFLKPKEQTTAIYLTNDELIRLAKHDFSTNKSLELARDIFLIGCEIGQRVSDYNGITNPKLNYDDNGNTFIEITQRKTEKKVNCYLSDLMRKIMKRYEGNFPPYLYDQDLNERLKIIGEIVEINDEILFERTEGGKLMSYKKLKWEMISSHSARRTFCTNKYLSGMPISDIMHLSGHTTEKEFSKYIRVEDLQRAISIIGTKEFQGSLIKY